MPELRSSLRSAIRRSIRRHGADLVDFASAMIRVRSENPPGDEYSKCAKLIASKLRELGLAPRIVDPSGTGPCVLGTFGEGGRALYFSGHYDVVPAQEVSQFSPVVRGGKLYGRGSADMKGGIAVMAFAIHALAEAGFEPKGRVISVSVPDEETSGPRGTPSLISAGIIERDALGMLTPEPTTGVVWHANRGVISLRVTVHGRPAHVGLHFEGVNAFRGMLDVANALRALEKSVSRRLTKFNVTPEAARQSVLLLGGELAGGHNFNVVPERVSFTVDRRTNPEEDFDTERDRLLELVDRVRADGVKCEVEIFQEGRSAATSEHEQLSKMLASNIRAVTGADAAFELCPGVLETRHYAAIGIPALAYGPGPLSVAHGPNEHVSVKGLLECAEVYALTAAQLLG
jgi:succinyl-diaminopimelate desuccinylase